MKHDNPHLFLQANVCGLTVTTDKECAFTHTYKTTNTFNKHGHKHGYKAPKAVHITYTTFFM